MSQLSGTVSPTRTVTTSAAMSRHANLFRSTVALPLSP
jgi:hypothetical protein